MAQRPALQKNTVQGTLWLALAGAFLLRLVLAYATEGYAYDMSCFVAWGDKLAAEGPAAFYSADYFADYPPGYLLVLGAVGLVRKAFAIPYEAKLTYLLLAVVPALCDCACVWLIWRVGQKRLGAGPALRRLTLFAAFCPLTLFDTGVWKQIDGAFALPVLLCFWLLEEKRYLPAAFCYGLALAIKPQALLAGPVLAVCFLAGVAAEAAPAARLRAVGRIFGGAALALLPALLCGLPFFGWEELLPKLWQKYTETSASYPYATINAFNWFAALGGNWVQQTGSLLGPVTWQALGSAHILLMTAALFALAVISYRKNRFSPLLLAAFYTVGVFTLSHRMHERYLVFGVLLTLLAAARLNDVRLLGAGAGLSLTGFLNLACVYSLVGGDDEWLTSATSSLFGRIVGFGEMACFVVLAFAVYDILVKGVTLPLQVPLAAELPRRRLKKAPPVMPALAREPAPQPGWTRREGLTLLALTAAVAVVSFSYLGELTAPQTPLDATGTTKTEQFSLSGETVPVTIWVYPGISTGGSLTVTDADTGEEVYTKTLDYSTTFCWTAENFTGTGKNYTVTVENASVFEISLRDASGKAVAVSGGGALLDEQALVPQTISQLNSMYFDEIYHGRTGYEMLHGLTVYETTHPPLGKDFILLGIAIFGMTGFGWRFSGALFGVLLVPLAYLFVRRLTRKPWVALAAAGLLAFDFMRFAQSRIATIDIYGTFFILLGAYFMLWYCQSVLEKGVCRSVLPMALGGMAFGLGCASKWTGIYAGAGLAVLYLGVLYARWRQKKPGFRREFAAAAAGGVAFYILLPLAIYLASYLPYWLKDSTFGLSDWWSCQTYMYWYHSTLEATHPFQSNWYTWPLVLRPVWYYMNTGLSSDMAASIAGIGGPVLWLGGLAALLLLGWRQLCGKGERRGALVLVLYATQLIPWMLVTRCTFMYHYFPSSMFGLAAIALALAQAKNEARAKKLAAALVGVSAVLFVVFYPALSGLPIPRWWANALKVLPSWGFY